MYGLTRTLFFNDWKMKKLCLIFIGLLPALLYGQQTKVNIICRYDMSYTNDTTRRGYNRKDIIILKIGNGISECYSEYTHTADSIMALPDGAQVMGDLISREIRNGSRNFPTQRSGFHIYKHPDTGKMTVHDRVQREYYVYEDSLTTQQWELLDSSKTVLGYACRYAKCFFRGREYYAWFTPEVAVGEGPWKFYGLPGLIMEVGDSRNQYHFIITGIYPDGGQGTIAVPKKTQDGTKFIKTDRKAFLRLSEKYLKDVGGYTMITSTIRVEGVTESNPKILRYDLMERDYKN